MRELENAMERAVILHAGRAPSRRTRSRIACVSGAPSRSCPSAPRANPTLETVERAYILWVLQSEQGNKTRAADVLGIDPSTLHRKLARFGVDE